MKLRKEDQDWLTSEIARVVKESNADLQKSLRPGGMRTVMLWLKDWGAISAVWAVPLALMAMVITLAVFAGNGISKNATFQGVTENRLTAIEKSLQAVHDQLTRQTLTNQAALPLEEFRKTLPTLISAISTARERKVAVSIGIIDNIQKKLVATEDTSPGYWQAAAQLISYRSVPVAMSPDDQQCRDLNINFDQDDDEHLHIEVANCTFDLDNNPAFKGGGFPQAKFLILHNARIRYRGGPITDLPPLLVFDHCVFDFQMYSPPPPQGQHLTETLLAATDINKVSFGAK